MASPAALGSFGPVLTLPIMFSSAGAGDEFGSAAFFFSSLLSFFALDFGLGAANTGSVSRYAGETLSLTGYFFAGGIIKYFGFKKRNYAKKNMYRYIFMLDLNAMGSQ